MKEKWKLCVISGGVLACSILVTSILLNHTMSSADDQVKEFAVSQEESETSAVSWQAVSGEAVQNGAVTGGAVSEEDGAGDGKTGVTPEPTERPAGQSGKKSGKSGAKTYSAASYDRKPEEESGETSHAYASVSATEENDGFSAGLVILDPSAPLGVQIANYAIACQGVRYVSNGTKLPDIYKIAMSDIIYTSSDEEMKDKKLDVDIWGDEYGVDCASLVQKVFETFDVTLPGSVKEQAEEGEEVKLKDIEAGDLIFYGANNETVTHCGIYVGSGQIIHVSAQTKKVVMSDMNYRRIAKVKRVVES